LSEQLLTLWLAILAVAGRGDDAAFRSAQKQFVDLYKRASNPEQGAFHWLLAADNRRWTQQ